MEEKLKKLSDMIVNYSLQLKEGDRVLIVAETLNSKELLKLLIKDIIKVKAVPNVKIIDEEISTLIKENLTDDQIELEVKKKEYEVENHDAFITIRYSTNKYEEKNISKESLKKLGTKTLKLDDIRINERRWVLLNYPSVLDAFRAKKKTDEFLEYALDVMTIDYEKMNEKLKPLKELMEKTDMVRIIGKGTNLTFSIKDIPVVPCAGDSNIPDGEVFTAPVKTSVNGYINYNAPSSYMGHVFNNVKLTFKDGRIIDASCDENSEELNKIFDSDEGARYIGEFSLGLNPLIKDPMGDILYDEKITGSIHFTPGRAYREADNGNESSIHWDLVNIQRSEYGGGEIYFDDVLIRKDGLFVLDELKELNPKA